MANFNRLHIPGSGTDLGVAVVIYGLDPIPGQLDNTIKVLAETNDVFTYTYGSDVAFGGNPKALPNLIDEINTDVLDITSETDPERVIVAGPSLGTFIGNAIQNRNGFRAPGLYATAGVNAARNIMVNPVFRKARKAFELKEVGLKELHEAWKDVDIYPDRPSTVPAVCAISRLDPVVPYPEANRNLTDWQSAGSPLIILRNWKVGHTAAINHYNSGIREIIEISKVLQ